MKFRSQASGAAMIGAAAIVGLSLGAGTAAAQSVEERIKKLEMEIEALKNQAAIEKWGAAPKFSQGKDWDFKVRGRIQTDWGAVDGDKSGFDYDQGSEFRRVRLGVEGTANTVFKYKLEVDFADNEVSLSDAYLQYKGLDFATVTVGHFKEAASLEEKTSSRHSAFMERGGFTDAFGFQKRLGLGVNGGGDKWGWEVAVQGEGAGNDNRPDEGYAVSGRVHISPFRSANGNITTHLGGWAMMREFGDGDTAHRYRHRPQFHGTNRFINTGSIADNDTLYGIEGAVVAGPAYIAGEYAMANADLATPVATATGSGDPDFDGFYVHAGWFLTGEMRSYDAGKGAFGRIKPDRPINKGGWGALSVNVGYDVVDLGDNLIQGGKQDAVLLGLNWHPTNYTKVMLNYANVDIEDSNAATISDEEGNNFFPFGSDSLDIFMARAQIDW